MARFVVIVLDGFGIGAMEDVPRVRPADEGANTCRRILTAFPDLHLPVLERLGLMNAAGFETASMHPARGALYGRSELMHFWADTFFGHQESMGTKPTMPKGHPFQQVRAQVARALEAEGFQVRTVTTENGGILVVNEAATVGDNIECDPQQAINVTAAIDDISFEEELRIGRIVRRFCTTPRVIVFGGRGVHLPQLLGAIQTPNGLAGVNAPLSGVYKEDYHCMHLGYGIDPEVQLPALLYPKNIPVVLLGKVADIVANPQGESYSIVETEQVLQKTTECIDRYPTGFFCANVQETDLCGHREDAAAYARILERADRGIGALLEHLSEEDILVVMADHGNDPGIGHPHHTRERVPLLIRTGSGLAGDIGTRHTLSDVGATAADFFGVTGLENGKSFLGLIRQAGQEG